MPHIQDVFNVLLTSAPWNNEGPIHLGFRTAMVDEFLVTHFCGTFLYHPLFLK